MQHEGHRNSYVSSAMLSKLWFTYAGILAYSSRYSDLPVTGAFMSVVESEKRGVQRLSYTRSSDGNVDTNVSAHQSSYVFESREESRERKPIGWLYPKPYSFYLRNIVATRGRWTWELPGYYYRKIERSGVLAPQFGTAYDGPSSVAGRISSDALTKAMLKVVDMKFNAGQALAEANKTASLLSETAELLGSAYIAIKTRDWRKLRLLTGWDPNLAKVSRNAASAWLKYRYGWTPLLMDVYGAAEQLAETIHGRKTMVVKHTVSEKILETTKQSGGEYSCYRATRGLQSCFVRFDFLPTGGVISAMNNVGLANPLQLAWELLPYSFVVDWFVPIGSALSCKDFANGISWKSGSSSNWLDCQTETTESDYLAPGVSASVFGSNHLKRLDREVLASPPSVPLPHMRVPFPSSDKVLDSLALLRNAFK